MGFHSSFIDIEVMSLDSVNSEHVFLNKRGGAAGEGEREATPRP